MKVHHVSAFTFKNQGGNMAGVIILDPNSNFPSDEEMIKVAAYLNYSETSFVKILGNNRFHTRYFTPLQEVDLCGHATIATFAVLKEEGLLNEGPILNITGAGPIEIYINDDRIFMDMAKPTLKYKLKEDDAFHLAEVIGLSPLNRPFIKEHLPMIISTGLPDIIMELPSFEHLMNLNVNMDALTEFSNDFQVIGLHCFARKTDNSILYHCRNFAPACGIDEECATGTSNGALTYYLFLDGSLAPGKQELFTDFLQGESMNMPSLISTALSSNGTETSIKVGGKASIKQVSQYEA